MISIHTSAKEVTIKTALWRINVKISIHTSAKEVTIIWDLPFLWTKDFNPHFREGSDRYVA